MGIASFPGDVSLGDSADDSVFVNGTLRTAIPLGSGQIKFPAVTVPSTDPNTLDDYAEGLFTPAYSAGASVFSYALQYGIFTKVGRLVNFSIRIILNTTGNTLTADTLSITSLPYPIKADVNKQVINAVLWNNTATAYVYITSLLNSGTSTTTLLGATAATSLLANSGLAANAFLSPTAGTVLVMTGAYDTD